MEQKLLFILQFFATGKVLLSCAVVPPSVLLYLFVGTFLYCDFSQILISISISTDEKFALHDISTNFNKKRKTAENNIKKCAENSIQNVKKLIKNMGNIIFSDISERNDDYSDTLDFRRR